MADGATMPTAGVNLQREHQRGLALVNPLVEQLSAITIEDEASYLQADALLGKIRNALKQWGTVWDMIQDRVVKPQREALDGVYSVNREVSGPMEKAEKLLKSKMKDYKDEEAKRIAQEIADRDAETDRLQQQIDDAKRREEMAKTPQARRVAQRQIVALDSTQQAVIENTPMAVQGSSSSTRTVKVPIVTNLQHLMMALSVGSLKAETALWDKIYESVQAIIKTEGKSQARKDEMMTWPGITIQDETQIVGR